MRLAESVADVLLPRFCKVCGRRLAAGEKHLCAVCTIGMPVLKYRRDELSQTECRLLGEKSLVRAASFMTYDKESGYSRIMYHLKYYGHPHVGRWLAVQAARQLLGEGFFDGVDFIVPVPLAPRKLRRRGYNQCDYIASGIRDVTGLPVRDDAVARRVSNQVQAREGWLQRWSNAEGIFCVKDARIMAGRHVLIVDDILTTGATVSSLIDVMQDAAPDIRVSVFTLCLSQ